jgi:hypothetical protein
MLLEGSRCHRRRAAIVRSLGIEAAWRSASLELKAEITATIIRLERERRRRCGRSGGSDNKCPQVSSPFIGHLLDNKSAKATGS